mgnify:FL=1
MAAIIYTKNLCPYCDMAKKLLDEKGIEYEEINVNSVEDPQAVIDTIRSLTDAKTFPQIVLDGQLIGGYTDLRSHFYTEE